MTKLTASAQKNIHGAWSCETTLDINPSIGKINCLKISTMKRSSGRLVTMATAGTSEDYGNGMASFSFMMFQDYNEKIADSAPGRVTAKVVEAQHNAIDADEVLEKVKAFYNK